VNFATHQMEELTCPPMSVTFSYHFWFMNWNLNSKQWISLKA